MDREDLENFYQWLRDRGCLFEGVEIRPCNDGSGNGLFSLMDFKEDDPIITLPRSLLITNSWISKTEPYKSLLQRCQLNQFEVLLLFILNEDSNQSSSFRPYLKVLPRKFDIITFTGYDEKLHSAIIYPEYKKREDHIVAMFANFKQQFQINSLEYFRWALHVVNTRYHYLVNQESFFMEPAGTSLAVLMPFVDMMNHSNKSSVCFFFDEMTGNVQLVAKKKIRANDQILLCYAEKKNGILWLDHGFTIPNNEHNRFEIKIEELAKLMNSFQMTVTSEHEKIAQGENSHSNMISIKAYNIDSFLKFSRIFRILAMNPNELRNWKNVLLESREIDKKLMLDVLRKISFIYTSHERISSPTMKYMWSDQIFILQSLLAFVSTF